MEMTRDAQTSRTITDFPVQAVLFSLVSGLYTSWHITKRIECVPNVYKWSLPFNYLFTNT